ncbi:MAG: tetratricopeptide repeat protein [Actinomycetota bacterium]|nr:tetratricopeptide repeat protein [Actinomycetota bacterium]
MADNAYDLLQEARKHIEGRQPERAVSLLERAKKIEPRRGSILEALGIAYYNSGDHENAMREFEEALEVDPTNHYARYGMSCCLYRKGMLSLAIGQVKLAAVMEPDNDLYGDALERYQRERESGGKRNLG